MSFTTSILCAERDKLPPSILRNEIEVETVHMLTKEVIKIEKQSQKAGFPSLDAEEPPHTIAKEILSIFCAHGEERGEAKGLERRHIASQAWT